MKKSKPTEPLRRDGILIFRARSIEQADDVLRYLHTIKNLAISGRRIVLNQHDAKVPYDARTIDIFGNTAKAVADMLTACKTYDRKALHAQ